MPDELFTQLALYQSAFCSQRLGRRTSSGRKPWGSWEEAVSQQGRHLRYWKWRESPKQRTIADLLIVTTATGVRFKSHASSIRAS